MSGFSTDIGWSLGLNVVWQSEGLSKKRRKQKKFKEYDVDALITKVSPRGGFAKLDKGYNSHIEKGMKMDIYDSDFRGRNTLVGTGVVYESKRNWSILKIQKKYIDRPLKPGLMKSFSWVRHFFFYDFFPPSCGFHKLSGKMEV